ncbi:MAG TPA: hypothetical protein VFA45_08215 [Actinomycetes bacterium]|nr:hypothetical protein [Actinomycetes bacterium]
MFDPDVDTSVIELGLHQHWRCRVDCQAGGTLLGFASWTAAAEPALVVAVMRAAAGVGERIGGNIGHRDHVRYPGQAYDLVEARGRRGDFASWRVYLVDRSTMTARRLEVVTHGGSTAFANPTATCLRDPSGHDAVVVSSFLPVEGAAAGEAGSLLYYVPIEEPARQSEAPGAPQPGCAVRRGGGQHRCAGAPAKEVPSPAAATATTSGVAGGP